MGVLPANDGGARREHRLELVVDLELQGHNAGTLVLEVLLARNEGDLSGHRGAGQQIGVKLAVVALGKGVEDQLRRAGIVLTRRLTRRIVELEIVASGARKLGA